MIEIVSPGHKDCRASLREFAEKTADSLAAGIHILVVDLFPPTPRDPHGIHKAIWDQFLEEPFAFPVGKDRTAVSCMSGAERVAYIEPLALGDELPNMPLFLSSDFYVATPLESTYRSAWEYSPLALRNIVETGVLVGGVYGLDDLRLIHAALTPALSRREREGGRVAVRRRAQQRA